MSSIHYKFRATLEYKTLQFEGLHIRGEDLIREICSKENIKIELFNLLLQNAHTKKNYTDSELIPRNSSIVVQRVPREDAAKIQKVQSGVSSGAITTSETASSSSDVANIASADFEKMDETERLSHVRDVSTRAYDPSTFRRNTGGIMSGPPPPTYTCNRCYQPGHWYKNCPMINTKRTTGIPSQELMETTADDPQAMLHPSGKYVVPIMHYKARQDQARKAEDGSASPAPQDRKVPSELQCPLCHGLIKEAVVTSCCGNSYCADCIGPRIIDTESRKCPGTDCDNEKISFDALIPNKRLREAAEAWLNQKPGGTQDVTGNVGVQEAIRIRIGLQPRPVVTMSSPGPVTAPLVTEIQPAPLNTVPTTTQSSVSIPQMATPAVMQTINIPLDTSLPPPSIRVAAPETHVPAPSIPGVPGLGQVSYTTSLPGIPGIPGIPGVPGVPGVPGLSNQPMMSNYVMGNSMYAGFSGLPTSSSSRSGGIDAWDAFLRNKDSLSNRSLNRLTHDYERNRRGSRSDRDKDRRQRDSRKRRSSSSSSSSETDSDSSHDDRRRRRDRDRTTSKRSSRRSPVKDRSSRRDRDSERSRRERDSKSSRNKDYKERDRRDRSKDTSRKSRSRHEEDKKVEEERDDEKVVKEIKEDDDEAAIDGALAEYEKLKETTSNISLNEKNIEENENEDGKCEKEREEEEKAEEEPNEQSGSEAGEGETTRSERGGSDETGEEHIDRLFTTETSEAEVMETQRKDVSHVTEDSDVTADEKDLEESDKMAIAGKESQSSTAHSDNDEETKDKKKKKKNKKNKKHRKHREGDEKGEDGEKKKKKHKRNKKEKKSRKSKKEDGDDSEDAKNSKNYKKERKRSRELEESDTDAPKSKVRRSSDYDSSKMDRKMDDERDRRREKDVEKDRKMDDERDRRREKDVEKDRKMEDERDRRREKDVEKDRKMEDERDRRREKDVEKDRSRTRYDREKEKPRDRRTEGESSRSDRNTEIKKEGQKSRQSVHERLQRDDGSTKNQSSSSSSRKPVSFSLNKPPTENFKIRINSNSKETGETKKEEGNVSKKNEKDSSSAKRNVEKTTTERKKKDETDVESNNEKNDGNERKKSKKVRSNVPSTAPNSGVQLKNVKYKFDL